MEPLEPYLRGGVTASAIPYRHLGKEELMLYIMIYTVFFWYIDDNFNVLEGMDQFYSRFIRGEAQGCKFLEDYADFLRRTSKLWSTIGSQMIVTSILLLLSSCVLDNETEKIPINPLARDYCIWTRDLSGISLAYTVFAFPPDMPVKDYILAFPELLKMTNWLNDILSLYKEELAGETTNLISRLAQCQGVANVDVLDQILQETLLAYRRGLKILKPFEAVTNAYKAYYAGYLEVHYVVVRYKLQELGL
ncbi:hypothetical protein BDZ97DRAFT_1655289 [Flammula alnicola]|nr:hypothetical protein BDZ97DRAFT_1655289 [Flammula alnicola]